MFSFLRKSNPKGDFSFRWEIELADNEYEGSVYDFKYTVLYQGKKESYVIERLQEREIIENLPEYEEFFESITDMMKTRLSGENFQTREMKLEEINQRYVELMDEYRDEINYYKQQEVKKEKLIDRLHEKLNKYKNDGKVEHHRT